MINKNIFNIKNNFSSLNQSIRLFNHSVGVYSGHNKWSKVRHQKGAADKARSKVFAKMALDISQSVKAGGGSTDPNINNKLANALVKAKSLSIPKDNIESAIKRGSSGPIERGHNVTYEALVGDIGVIIECETANVTRCNQSVRTVLNKYGGTMGSCGYLFRKIGLITLELPSNISFDTLFEDAIDAGAEDIKSDNNLTEIITEPTEVAKVANLLIEKGYSLTSYDLSFIPSSGERTPIDDETRQRLDSLIEALEDDADAVEIYTTS